MTIAEAIDRLERRYMTMSMGFIGDEGKEICKRENEAITMAINALRRHNLMKPAEEPATNADRIRAMSDEELAIFIERSDCPQHDWICETDDKSCKDCWLEWLQSPAGGDNDE